MTRIIYVLVLTVFMSGMMDGVRESTAQRVLPELPFVELHKADYTQNSRFTKKQTKVITSQADYAAELAIYTTAAPVSVDFTNGRVLLVDMGVRNTGGYSIAVTSVNATRNSVIANISLTKPGKYCATTQSLTNPYQFVFIPSLDEILISETVETTRCKAF